MSKDFLRNIVRWILNIQSRLLFIVLPPVNSRIAGENTEKDSKLSLDQ